MAQSKSAIIAQITKLEAKIAELRVKAETAVDAYTPVVGDVVNVRVGRADTAHNVVGTVRAIGTVPLGKGTGTLVAVEVGEGLEAKIVRVNVSAISAVVVEPSADEVLAA